MKKGIVAAAAAAAVCAAAIIAAALNMDALLSRFAPELYLGYVAVNTANQITEEQAMIRSAMPEMPELSKSHTMSLELKTENHELSLTESYNRQTPSAVFNGTYNGIPFDGYINNSETGLCLPDLLDIYFTFSTQNFGDEFNDGGASSLLPVSIPRGTDLTLPGGSGGAAVSPDRAVSIMRSLAEGAKLRHDSGDEYFLILKSENVNKALGELASAFFDSPSVSEKISRADRLFGTAFASAGEYIKQLIPAGSTENETVTARIKITNGIAAAFEMSPVLADGSVLNVSAESRGARLLDDYTVSIVSESETSRIGAELMRSGSRMFADEEKTDSVRLKLFFGREELLDFASNISIDKNNTSFSGSVSIVSPASGSSIFSADIDGGPADGRSMLNGVTAEIKNINTGGSLGTCSVRLMPPSDMPIPEREKYPFRDVDIENMTSLLEIMRQ